MVSSIILNVTGNAGMLECQNAGMPECWNAGMPECWNAGMLECRNAHSGKKRLRMEGKVYTCRISTKHSITSISYLSNDTILNPY